MRWRLTGDNILSLIHGIAFTMTDSLNISAHVTPLNRLSNYLQEKLLRLSS